MDKKNVQVYTTNDKASSKAKCTVKSLLFMATYIAFRVLEPMSTYHMIKTGKKL